MIKSPNEARADLGFVHRYLPAPNGGGRTLLLLHGTGADESDLIPLGRALDPRAALLSPRGKVSENDALRFFRRLAEGVFDEEDLIRRAHELADFIVAAAKKYALDQEKITALGYSNGANIAAAMMLLRPEVLRGAVLFRAMVGLTNPPQADLKAARILISNGAMDPIIPLENGQRLAGLLRAAGAQVSFKAQNATHALVREDLQDAAEFLGDAG